MREAQRLVAAGWSATSIAAELGVHHTTIIRWTKPRIARRQQRNRDAANARAARRRRLRCMIALRQGGLDAVNIALCIRVLYGDAYTPRQVEQMLRSNLEARARHAEILAAWTAGAHTARAIAEQLDLSRARVYEALRDLAAEGVIPPLRRGRPPSRAVQAAER